ncbi:3-phosphoglycerate dehydrogenase family protein [Gammaproteobacteria bacterium]|nr:3-phosphoglycerate dehydrogenase family protein [Gammaproteobacteria bacterium]MDC0410178.1 3-phosphoglycerate dehydrogenase family protein [Gammaproteobacteria bacterium]|tara:strand:+ start:708 stop:1886 length:1179 start_codon:yes stop_codon:yes gene_type:complete
MYKYKIYNNIAKEGLDILNQNMQEDQVNPDTLLLRSQVLQESDFNSSLKCVGRAGAGTNNIPIAEATNKGVVVFNTPGANANAVKELVVCGMLLSSRGILQGSSFAMTLKGLDGANLNASMESEKKNFKGSELKGKTLGIVGLGAIGSLLAQTANIMGMKIIGYDPYISVDAAWRLPKEVEKADTLEALLSNSDYISLHVPLLESTKDLISSKTLNIIKKGAKIINLSRGGIVNNNDVIGALKSKQISRYVTDFPTPELIDRASENGDVILLPHLGASTKEAEVNCATMAAEQVSNFLANGTIINSVNFPSIKLGRTDNFRMVIINKNEPGMIGKIADKIASSHLNITDMTNKSRDDIAINLIDLDQNPSEEIVKDIESIEHVLSVRLCINS